MFSANAVNYKHLFQTSYSHSLALSLLKKSNRIVALTGAGISTDSGLRDYKSRGANYKSMSYADIAHNTEKRKKFWIGAFTSSFSFVRPNLSHYCLSALESKGVVSGVITQNVDGLHKLAGSRNVVELHGNGHDIVCQSCFASVKRRMYLDILKRENAELLSHLSDFSNPSDDIVKNFQEVPCQECGGWMKPNVVFNGEAILTERKIKAQQLMHSADIALILGTRLNMNFVNKLVDVAYDRGIPIICVSLGAVHRPERFTTQLDMPISPMLEELNVEIRNPR